METHIILRSIKNYENVVQDFSQFNNIPIQKHQNYTLNIFFKVLEVKNFDKFRQNREHFQIILYIVIYYITTISFILYRC